MYYTENKKPQDIIDQYSEPRLCVITLVFTAAFTFVYMVIGTLPWAIEPGSAGYGVLPTFAIGQFFVDDNNYSTYSLYFIAFGVFAEGLLFAYLLDSVKNIKKEFAMLPEMQWFSVFWLALTNLLLFLTIQGLFSNWYGNNYQAFNRIFFWTILIRSVVVSSLAAWPLYKSYKDEVFFPIPPNRECIESVDMALHIPIAVDYFYNFLQSRQDQLKDKQAINLIALYIDLRLYDKACTEDFSPEDKEELAVQIFETYFSRAALESGDLGISQKKSYFPV